MPFVLNNLKMGLVACWKRATKVLSSVVPTFFCFCSVPYAHSYVTQPRLEINSIEYHLNIVPAFCAYFQRRLWFAAKFILWFGNSLQLMLKLCSRASCPLTQPKSLLPEQWLAGLNPASFLWLFAEPPSTLLVSLLLPHGADKFQH